MFHWYCRLARLKYNGQGARMGENCIPNLILHWKIKEGCHKQGRPQKSFRQGLKNDLHKFELLGKYSQQNTFQKFVADRDKWRKMINTQAQIFEKIWEKIKLKEQYKKTKDKKQNINYIFICVCVCMCCLLPTHGWKVLM